MGRCFLSLIHDALYFTLLFPPLAFLFDLMWAFFQGLSSFFPWQLLTIMTCIFPSHITHLKLNFLFNSSRRFLCFLFDWCLFFLILIVPCYLPSFVCEAAFETANLIFVSLYTWSKIFSACSLLIVFTCCCSSLSCLPWYHSYLSIAFILLSNSVMPCFCSLLTFII